MENRGQKEIESGALMIQFVFKLVVVVIGLKTK